MRSIILSAIIGTGAAWAAPVANFLGEASFENPPVTGRTPETDEGVLPTNEGTPWEYFYSSEETEGGRVVVGLTNEIARTGKQSIYIDFQKVTATGRQAVLTTKLIAIKPAQAYRLSLWGRIDRKRPLSLDERRPFMAIDVEFFKADQQTKAGEPVRGFQLIPGRVIPGGPHPLVFLVKRWSESVSQLMTPADAAFLKVVWVWQVPTDPGETDGVVFWDDFALIEDQTPAKADAAEDPKAAPAAGDKTAIRPLDIPK